MAGTQDPNENPVAINVVPMVDVIFCLCVFFMCSFKFKQMEGRFESWLPDKGSCGDVKKTVLEEVRVALFHDEKTGATRRQFMSRTVPDDGQLESLLREANADQRQVSAEKTAMTIDSDPRVPWQDVVTVMDVARRAGMEKIEFAYGQAP